MAKRTNRPTDQRRTPQERRSIRRRSTDICVVSLAILFGLLGFVVHTFWVVAIVFIALLWGLLVSELGSLRGSGGASETLKAVVAEARDVKDEVVTGVSDAMDPREPESRDVADPDPVESGDEATKKELYEEAREAGIEGRSSMTKDELRQALDE
jgi:hypothetical protein